MTIFPVYQDTLAIANLVKGKLPFFIRTVTIMTKVRLHHHDFVELAFVYEGNGTEIINGKPHLLQPGTVTFLLPHHIHQIQCSDPASPIQLYCCMFDISMLLGPQIDAEIGYLLLKTGEGLPSYTDLPMEKTSEMKIICAQMLKEYNDNLPGKDSYLRSKLTEALLLFIRSHPNTETDRRKSKDAEARQKNWEMIQYVHSNYAGRLTAESLAERFNVSVSSVHRTFKLSLGQSFWNYLLALRVRRATGLLVATDMTVQQICVEVGFESFRTFSRVFKELTDMTPSGFRLASRQTQGKAEVPSN